MPCCDSVLGPLHLVSPPPATHSPGHHPKERRRPRMPALIPTPHDDTTVPTAATPPLERGLGCLLPFAAHRHCLQPCAARLPEPVEALKISNMWSYSNSFVHGFCFTAELQEYHVINSQKK
ncbi:UNVERIFIED_CONTAM: hypothetical protein K2H54_044044 [Gekko kuhli]